MDSGVDTGPMLSKFVVEPQHGDNIRSIRDRIEYHMTSVLVKQHSNILMIV